MSRKCYSKFGINSRVDEATRVEIGKKLSPRFCIFDFFFDSKYLLIYLLRVVPLIATLYVVFCAKNTKGITSTVHYTSNKTGSNKAELHKRLLLVVSILYLTVYTILYEFVFHQLNIIFDAC